jgi:nicotinamidase-related amidase
MIQSSSFAQDNQPHDVSTEPSSSPFSFRLRDLNTESSSGNQENATGTYRYRDVTWEPAQVAIIVCDAWDLHHSINAVRRLEEFAPRLNKVLTQARSRGATIIHAPSDCMDSYETHPARRRAIESLLTWKRKTGKAPSVDKGEWCLKVSGEAQALYPIDQSDGGEDDDPAEHAAWAAHLKALGRNPGMPWRKQTDLLTIDEERDYISSLGDEVWSVLEARGIRHVILTGVHLNMCVLGRPFGLRQMVRDGGRDVALMRDMTDTMYNPKRWPYVDHFTGTDLMVNYVERHVCPTLTSDQLLGGQPFRFSRDTRTRTAESHWPVRLPDPEMGVEAARRDWVRVSVPVHGRLLDGEPDGDESLWLRCVVGIPSDWQTKHVQLSLPNPSGPTELWWNGHAVPPVSRGGRVFSIPTGHVDFGTGNLLVLRFRDQEGPRGVPVLSAGEAVLPLAGLWQVRLGEDTAFSNLPLPAQFGGAADVVFQP